MRTRRLPAALLACTLALGLGACGEEHEVLTGETEGIYIQIDEVKYQVQMSRLLNTESIEDQAYVRFVPFAERRLEEDETWFGVWVRAENESDEPQPVAQKFHISDSLGNEYEPLEQPENILSWGYQPDVVPPEGARGLIPVPDSQAAESTIQGSLLLFKLPYAVLENRPLELEFESPTDEDVVGRVTLDV